MGFVEGLGNGEHIICAHAELSGADLLKGAQVKTEGGRRFFPLLCYLQYHSPALLLTQLPHRPGGLGIDATLFLITVLLNGHPDCPEPDALFFNKRMYLPPGLWHEGCDFIIPVNHHSKRRRLYPPDGQHF